MLLVSSIKIRFFKPLASISISSTSQRLLRIPFRPICSNIPHFSPFPSLIHSRKMSGTTQDSSANEIVGHVENKRPLVISGPSGSGKSTLLTRLFKQYPNTFGFSVSHTTRKPRPGEIDGVNYHYVNEEEFLNLVSANAFIEHAQFSGNRYGTSIKAVRDVMDSGKICVLDIDMQGVKSVKATDLHARFLFIRPPSFEALEQRLRSRNTETEDALKARLEAAKAEMEYAEVPGNHDYILVNDDVELAYQQLKGWILEHYKVLEPPVTLDSTTTDFAASIAGTQHAAPSKDKSTEKAESTEPKIEEKSTTQETTEPVTEESKPAEVAPSTATEEPKPEEKATEANEEAPVKAENVSDLNESKAEDKSKIEETPVTEQPKATQQEEPKAEEQKESEPIKQPEQQPEETKQEIVEPITETQKEQEKEPEPQKQEQQQQPQATSEELKEQSKEKVEEKVQAKEKELEIQKQEQQQTPQATSEQPKEQSKEQAKEKVEDKGKENKESTSKSGGKKKKPCIIM